MTGHPSPVGWQRGQPVEGLTPDTVRVSSNALALETAAGGRQMPVERRCDPVGGEVVQGPRGRILLGAYACGPGDEPEAAAGWAFARAAAAKHDVWVFTRPRFAAAIGVALQAEPELGRHLTVTYLDLPAALTTRKRRGHDVYWYYVLWQRQLALAAGNLHQHVSFDVVHHVTFASDWLPCGLTRLPTDVPLVWGPVGGATYLPWAMASRLGARALTAELLRSAATRVARRVWADRVARRAAIVVGQNDDTSRRFGYARRVVTEPNAALDDVTATRHRRPPGDGNARAVFVGRLIGWKGARLAVEAVAHPAAQAWDLDVYGSGPERGALETRIAELGLDGRVRLLGHRPRAEVLSAVAAADAMIFPSMHDSAGWAVGEASAAGCPVVCLDHGGPPLLAGPNAIAVRPDRAVVANLAAGLQRATAHERIPYPRWSSTRLPDLLAEWYADAASTSRSAQECGSGRG